MATIAPAWRVKVERGDAHRQTGSRLAVAPGIGTAGLHSAHHLLDHGVANHPPATAVRRQHLSEKHRQRLRRQKQPLAVIWQQRLYLIQQLRTGQQTEHRVGIGSARIHADSLLMPRHGAIARTCGLAPRAVAFALQLQVLCNFKPTSRGSQSPSIFLPRQALGFTSVPFASIPADCGYILLR